MRGRDAAAALDWMCANRVPAVGRLAYTQMLNSRGGIECDLTVARLAEDHFYIVTGTGFRTHDLAWIADHIPSGMDAAISDVTEAFGTLALMGPKARDVLSKVTAADVSNAAFPFGHMREIAIAGHRLRALRITYVGELGWELHIPIGTISDAYDALMSAGGVSNAGYRAIESLRLEKGYRAWGSDITPNDTPLHAGLGWAVKLKSNTPFLGRDACARLAAAPLTKMLAGFTTERQDIVLVGRETILRDGKFAGYLTSGGYGYTVEKPIGYGYVRSDAGVSEDYVRSGSYELVVAKEVVKAKVHLEPLHDPANARVKS
jgi:4-methylaminobutanoate oxidase (formaldehyde-forming)